MMQNIPKKKTDELMQCLHDPHFTSAMADTSSPLDPSLRCQAIRSGHVTSHVVDV